jgi:uncharacterized membrane protein YbhN (UPF0104 family)
MPGVSLERAVAAFAAARPPGLAGAFAFFLVSLLWSAEAWRAAVRACGGSTRRRRAAACYGAGSLVNSLLPARLGDALRVALFSRELGSVWAGGGILVAMEAARAVGMFALVAAAVAIGVMPLWPLAGLGALLLVAALVAGRARRIERSSRVLRLLDVFRVFGRSPRAAAAPVWWMTAALAARVAAAASVAAAFGAHSPLRAALVLVPAVEVAGLLPLTPGNIGLASAAITVALRAAGTPTAGALAIGVGFHALETAAGLSLGAASALYLGYASQSRRGGRAESAEKSPRSRIALAASAKAAAATHVSAPPTLTRWAPAPAISAKVRSGRASTFTGRGTASQTARISSVVRSPGA